MSSSPRPAVANANGHNRNENLASVAQDTHTRVTFVSAVKATAPREGEQKLSQSVSRGDTLEDVAAEGLQVLARHLGSQEANTRMRA